MFHSTIYLYQNSMRSGDCPEISYRNPSQTLTVPSYTLLFSLMLFSALPAGFFSLPHPCPASVLAPSFLISSPPYPLSHRNNMDSSMQIVTVFGYPVYQRFPCNCYKGSALSLEWECYLLPWESVNQEVFSPNFSSGDSNPFSSSSLSP